MAFNLSDVHKEVQCYNCAHSYVCIHWQTFHDRLIHFPSNGKDFKEAFEGVASILARHCKEYKERTHQ